MLPPYMVISSFKRDGSQVLVLPMLFNCVVLYNIIIIIIMYFYSASIQLPAQERFYE